MSSDPEWFSDPSMHRTLPGAVLAVASQNPQDVALCEDGDSWTYHQLAREVLAAARGMIAAGVEHGDRVALWAPNSIRWIVAALGIQTVGGVIVPINTRYKTQEACFPVGRTGAKLLVAQSDFMGINPGNVTQRLSEDGGAAPRVVDLSPTAWNAFVAEGSSVDDDQVRDALLGIEPNDLCDVMFTSGSTGRPKGVRHRHGPTLRQTQDTIEENGIRNDDQLLVVNPFFHVFGYTGGWVPGLLAGATVHPRPTFDVDEVLSIIESERITYFPGPPTIFHSILQHPDLDSSDLSSLRVSLTGSADVPVELIRKMRTTLGFERVIQAYGMTECGTATNTLSGDSDETVATTIGVASKDLEVGIVDGNNDPAAPGEPGEIVVRGYSVMDGYFDDPGATAATIDAEGWLHTGDLGSCDQRGYFQILGRIKDMYIVGGFNVYPAEVEDMIREHSAVQDVAVLGVPDERLGEVGFAFVILRNEESAEGFETQPFVSWCRERMANFKVPRHVMTLDQFPLTGSNKVSKPDLRLLIGDPHVS